MWCLLSYTWQVTKMCAEDDFQCDFWTQMLAFCIPLNFKCVQISTFNIPLECHRSNSNALILPCFGSDACLLRIVGRPGLISLHAFPSWMNSPSFCFFKQWPLMLVISGSKNFSTLKSGGMASPEVGPQFKKKKKAQQNTKSMGTVCQSLK